MKNNNGHTKKQELSLDAIRQIMNPCPVRIVPRELEASGVEEDTEFYGRNTDAARRIFREETGKTL